MTQEYSKRILNALEQKGWEVYVTRDVSGKKVSLEHINHNGPVKNGGLALEAWHNVWPAGFKFGDQDGLELVLGKNKKLPLPHINLPQGVFAGVTYDWAGGDYTPDIWGPGEGIDFIGFQLKEANKTKIIAPYRIIMHTSNFAFVLESSLNDITKLIK